MIVIVQDNPCSYNLNTGDTVSLVYESSTGHETLAKVEAKSPAKINRAILFLFCDQNGICSTFNVCGMFCDSLPDEFINARKLEDLRPDIINNLLRTSNLNIKIT